MVETILIWIFTGVFVVVPGVLGGVYMIFDIIYGGEYHYYKKSLKAFNDPNSLRLSCNEAIEVIKFGVSDDIKVELWGDNDNGWYCKVGIYSSSGKHLGTFSFTSAMEAMKFNRKIKKTLLKELNLNKKREMYERIRKELNN